VTIPEGVTRIEMAAFASCPNLTSVRFPATLQSIRERAFLSCTSLTAIDIPASVREIALGAFFGCSALRDVTVHWETPLYLSQHIFTEDVFNAATLHVPPGTEADYRRADVWMEFHAIDGGGGAESRHPDDVAFLRQFLAANGNWQQVGLDAGYEESLPDWPGQVEGIEWSSSLPKRIREIRWDSRALSGSMDVSALAELVTLRVAGNSLWSLTVGSLPRLEYVDCSHSNLFLLDISGHPGLRHLDCRENMLTFGRLPNPGSFLLYYYLPQIGYILTVKPDGEADLTDYLHGSRTAFEWYREDNTRLTDITESRPGIFRIPAACAGSRLMCRMTNGDFPDFDVQPLVCRVDVTGEAPVKAEQTGGETGGDGSKGSIDVKVRIPSGAQRMKGSLRIESGRDIVIDVDETMEESMKRYNGYMETVEDAGTSIWFSWWTNLAPFSVRAATRADAGEETDVITVYYDLSESLPDGEYTVKLTDLRFDFDDGTSYREAELPATVTVSRNASAQIPTDGLVAWFPFDGNALDASGNGNNGAVHGATLTKDRFGKDNSAYYFDGNGAYIDGNITNGNFTTEITVSFWHNPYAIRPIFYVNGEIMLPDDPLFLFTGDSKFAIKFGYVSENKAVYWINSGVAYNDHYPFPVINKWYHVVVKGVLLERENCTNMDVYINGDNIRATLCTPKLLSNCNQFSIGKGESDQIWSENSPTGILDDIRIYNRALSDAEIEALYNEGKAAPGENPKEDPNATEPVSEAPQVQAYISSGRLHVNTPVAETVSVYSVSGSKLFQVDKGAGAATFDAGSLPRGILIVRGGSGWAGKVIR
jgi:hypothetical protein